MRALVLTGREHVELMQVEPPRADAAEAVVYPQLAGICGSDISGFLGHSPRRQPPLILGHEMFGHLADGQPAVVNPLISCGSCRTCISGHQNLCVRWRLLGMDREPGVYAEAVKAPRPQILPIPPTLPPERAVWTEPLANLVHLFRGTASPPLASLAVVGAGAMGSLAVCLGSRLGFRDILALDVNPQRVGIMPVLGAAATALVRTDAEITAALQLRPEGFDLVIDASGAESARSLAMRLCRSGGQVVFLGLATGVSSVDFAECIRKERRLLTSFAYTPQDFAQALDLLIAGTVDLSAWSETMPLERGQEAFARMSTNPGGVLKMLLRVSA